MLAILGIGFILFWIVIIILSGLKIIHQYERGIKFSLGKYAGIMQPGLNLIIPVVQSWQKVDIRTTVVDVPDQDCMTKENISVKVNAVLYYKIMDSKKSILEVENYHYAVSQLSQTTMRDVVGEVELDELLSNRDEISNKIRIIIDEATDSWGIKVASVDLKHIELPKEMVRTMAKAAEAEREKRANITKAEGEVIASKNMAIAAKTLSSSAGALHLRTLQSLNDLSSDQSNTIIFAIPLEVLRAFEGYGRKKKK